MHLFKPVPMILSAAMSDIGGRIYHRLFTAYGGGPIGPHLRHHMRLFTLTPTCGGKGDDGNLPSSHGGGTLAAVTSSESSFLCQCRPH
jgi:hypothetical protein